MGNLIKQHLANNQVPEPEQEQEQEQEQEPKLAPFPNCPVCGLDDAWVYPVPNVGFSDDPICQRCMPCAASLTELTGDGTIYGGPRWSLGVSIDPCIVCGKGVLTRDPDKKPRHPECSLRKIPAH